MGRPFAGDPRRVLDTVRSVLPHAALRTTFIVGYPGETEEHFESLCRFVEESRFRTVAYLPTMQKTAPWRQRCPIRCRTRSNSGAGILSWRFRPTSAMSCLPRRWAAVCRCWWMPRILTGPACTAGACGFRRRRRHHLWSGPGVAPGALVDCDIVENTDYDSPRAGLNLRCLRIIGLTPHSNKYPRHEPFGDILGYVPGHALNQR